MEERLIQLEEKIKSLENKATIPFEVEYAFKDRLNLTSYTTITSLPSGLFDAPLSSITSPTGGATIDTQARTAIDLIITRLESLGLVSPN